MNTDTKNLAALEQLLTDVRKEYPAIAETMSDAIAICRSGCTVHGGVHLHLQAALASLRTGRPDDATRYIEIALGIEERWVRGSMKAMLP